MAQILTGKGCFEMYLFQIKGLGSAACLSCGHPAGSVDHHIEECQEKAGLRTAISNRVGALRLSDICAENMVQLLPLLALFVPKYINFSSHIVS